MGLPCKTGSCFHLGVRFPDGTLQTTAATTTPALPNGTTATTQAAGDNTASLATDAFVTTAINNAIAAVNPAVAVLAATTGSNLVGTYTQVGGGIGDTFTVTATGAFTLDGVAINTIGQRILIKDQTSGQQNGVYFASVVGATLVSPVFTRSLDYGMPSDVNNTGSIPVQSGTVNALTSWLLISQVTAIGSSGSVLTYAKFSANPTATQSANTVYSGPASGGAAAPTFRALVDADLPGGTTGTGAVVLATGPTLSNPIVGTQSPLDNSTKAASTAYTDAAVAAVIQAASPSSQPGFNPSNFACIPGAGGINSALTIAIGPNIVFVMRFILPFQITIRRGTASIGTLVAAKTFCGGIYSMAGNKLFEVDFSTASAVVVTGTSAVVTLAPGEYWYAFGATDTATLRMVGVLYNNVQTAVSNKTNVSIGTAANAISSSVLPATLGAITVTNAQTGIPFFYCEEN